MEWLRYTMYINLDSRKDRNQWMLNQLQTLQVTGIRMPAIEHQYGAIGCTLSHIACIQYAKENNFPMVCILEDDVWFMNPSEFQKKIEAVKNAEEKWDVLLLGANNYQPFVACSDDFIKVSNAQSAVAYIVQQSYYDILIDNMSQSVMQLANEPFNKEQYALDMYWKQLQRRDVWYMIIPPCISQVPDYSDIEERMVDYSYFMLQYDKTK
jgi:glycosyl transferase family 25